MAHRNHCSLTSAWRADMLRDYWLIKIMFKWNRTGRWWNIYQNFKWVCTLIVSYQIGAGWLGRPQLNCVIHSCDNSNHDFYRSQNAFLKTTSSWWIIWWIGETIQRIVLCFSSGRTKSRCLTHRKDIWPGHRWLLVASMMTIRGKRTKENSIYGWAIAYLRLSFLFAEPCYWTNISHRAAHRRWRGHSTLKSTRRKYGNVTTLFCALRESIIIRRRRPSRRAISCAMGYSTVTMSTRASDGRRSTRHRLSLHSHWNRRRRRAPGRVHWRRHNEP